MHILQLNNEFQKGSVYERNLTVIKTDNKERSYLEYFYGCDSNVYLKSTLVIILRCGCKRSTSCHAYSVRVLLVGVSCGLCTGMTGSFNQF